MAKIVIIAPAEADDDVKDAVKLLKAAGHDVDTDEPTPKSLLHIVLGLLGPNAYGFGSAYAYGPGVGGSAPPADDDKGDDKGDDADTPPADDADADTPDDADTGGDADVSNDDFNFESLGTVTVDGELIEAITHDSETSVLCVEGLISGPKTTYALNESIFSFWPANVEAPAQRVEVLVNENQTSIELPVQKSEGKSQLLVGKDLRAMFAESLTMGMSDEVAATKIFKKIMGEPNLKTARVKELIKQYLPMVKKDERDIPHLLALVLTKLEDKDMI